MLAGPVQRRRLGAGGGLSRRPASAEPSAGSLALAQQLVPLEELRSRGTLSDQAFEEAKSRLLGSEPTGKVEALAAALQLQTKLTGQRPGNRRTAADAAGRWPPELGTDPIPAGYAQVSAARSRTRMGNSAGRVSRRRPALLTTATMAPQGAAAAKPIRAARLPPCKASSPIPKLATPPMAPLTARALLKEWFGGGQSYYDNSRYTPRW